MPQNRISDTMTHVKLNIINGVVITTTPTTLTSTTIKCDKLKVMIVVVDFLWIYSINCSYHVAPIRTSRPKAWERIVGASTLRQTSHSNFCIVFSPLHELHPIMRSNIWVKSTLHSQLDLMCSQEGLVAHECITSHSSNIKT
jgi:hypothetical protein